MSDLDGLLQLLEGEGQFHSRGEFTLDAGRNREKIAHLLQEDVNSWLYWWVRCGVSLQSRACEVVVGRNALLAQLKLQPVHPLRNYLDRGVEEGQAGLRYLRLALLWAQAWLGLNPDFEATLLLEEPGQPLLALRLEADRVLRQQEARVGENLLLTLVFTSRQQRSRAAFWQAQKSSLAARLPARVGFSPMPVFLDGQRQDLGFQACLLPLYTRYYLQSESRNSLAVPLPPAAHFYRLETPSLISRWTRPRFCLPPVSVHTFSLAGDLPEGAQWSLSEGSPVAAWRTEKEASQLYVRSMQINQSNDRWLVRAAMQRRGADNDYWLAVQHGVSLDPEPMELGQGSRLGWLAAVGLDGAQTDLSGLKLVQDSLFDSVRDWVRQEIAEIHQQQAAAGF
ncbi:MAG: hypothetical protein U0931_16040 [Vulcanimicrobiota bacterium]